VSGASCYDTFIATSLIISMSTDYQISKQHLSGDEEYISFTIQFGDQKRHAVISRSALTVMSHIPDRHIFGIFEENHAVIANAARRKLDVTPAEKILQLGSDDF